MAIPSTPELMRPVLSAHADGAEHRLDALETRLALELGLSDAEVAQQQASGDRTFWQRVGWARNYLVQLHLLERAERSATRITAAGKDAVASNEPIAVPVAEW